eukprot:772019-Pleurochrysis_carterae.AAC.3
MALYGVLDAAYLLWPRRSSGVTRRASAAPSLTSAPVLKRTQARACPRVRRPTTLRTRSRAHGLH